MAVGNRMGAVWGVQRGSQLLLGRQIDVEARWRTWRSLEEPGEGRIKEVPRSRKRKLLDKKIVITVQKRERYIYIFTNRAFKLGSLPSAILENIVHANIRTGKLLVSSLFRSIGTISVAISILTETAVGTGSPTLVASSG